jgi:hypothetical protein
MRKLRGVSAFLQELKECRIPIQNKVDSVKMIVKLKGERLRRFHNEMDLVQKMVEVEDIYRVHLLNEVETIKTVLKETHKQHAVLQDTVDSMKTTMKKMEHERRAQAQKELDPMKTISEEDKSTPHSQNEVGSMKFNMEKLPLMLTEEIAGDPAPMESSVEMEKFKGNKIVASNSSDKDGMKIQISKVRVGLTPPPKVEADREPNSCLETTRSTDLVRAM